MPDLTRAQAERLLAELIDTCECSHPDCEAKHAKARAAVLDAMTRATPPCSWSYDDWDCKWDSACGESYQFMDGGPTENSYKHCPNCGGAIVLAAVPEATK